MLRRYQCLESTAYLEFLMNTRDAAFKCITIKWRTVDKTAISGKDYVGGEGEIEFKHGETQRDLKIQIIDDMECEKDENFEVELFEPNNGAQLGKITRTAVTVTNDDEFTGVMNKLMLMTNANVDELRVNNETWAQQFKDAMVVNGGDIEGATTGDYVMHFLTFGFKVSCQVKGRCTTIVNISQSIEIDRKWKTVIMCAVICTWIMLLLKITCITYLVFTFHV